MVAEKDQPPVAKKLLSLLAWQCKMPLAGSNVECRLPCIKDTWFFGGNANSAHKMQKAVRCCTLAFQCDIFSW